MLIRRERPDDVPAIDAVVSAAFAKEPGQRPIEAGLVDDLRASQQWIPALSLVADREGVVGHVVCSRSWVEQTPVLGLGPLAVAPEHQGRGIGSALVHAVLGAADALDEPLVALLGNPAYYSRFGFRIGSDLAVACPYPDAAPAFQVRTLATYRPDITGTFAYAEAFDNL